MTTIPIFPLNTVLYPQGILPLRIFEARYIDMVSECMKEQKDFGVCLINQGNETGVAATVHDIGTTARIIDWDQNDDGTLLITAEGQQRFRIMHQTVRANQLREAEVQLIDIDDENLIPPEYQLFVDLLRQVIDRFKLPLADDHEKFEDAYWVGCRLIEILPIDLENKQALLEMDHPMDLLHELQTVIEKIEIESKH